MHITGQFEMDQKAMRQQGAIKPFFDKCKRV